MDISGIVTQLQKQRVFVRTVIMDNLLGGIDDLMMYNISSQTNGFAVFTNQDSVDDAVDFCTNDILTPYLLYAYNVYVSGQGSSELPMLHTPSYFFQTIPVTVEFTVQDHPLSDDFRSLNLTLTDTSGKIQKVTIDRSRFVYFNGYYNTNVNLRTDQDFEVTIGYQYESNDTQSLEIQMSINQ